MQLQIICHVPKTAAPLIVLACVQALGSAQAPRLDAAWDTRCRFISHLAPLPSQPSSRNPTHACSSGGASGSSQSDGS